jgi:hypothetical protein
MRRHSSHQKRTAAASTVGGNWDEIWVNPFKSATSRTTSRVSGRLKKVAPHKVSKEAVTLSQ